MTTRGTCWVITGTVLGLLLSARGGEGTRRVESLFGTTSRDDRVRLYVQPTRVVWQTKGNAAPENSAILLKPGSGQSTVWARPGCILRNRGSAPGICLDFGRELNGGVQLICGDTPKHRPVPLRIRFGESVSEAMGRPNNDHAVHDSPVHVPWMGVTEIGNTGFRFVRIDLLEKNCHVELKEVRAVARYRDLNYKGSFQSSDERLNHRFEVSSGILADESAELLRDFFRRLREERS